jgi:hypothetical protein
MEIAATTIDKVLSGLASQPDPRCKNLDLAQQRKQIQAELNSSAPKDGMMRVITRMHFQEAPNLKEFSGRLVTSLVLVAVHLYPLSSSMSSSREHPHPSLASHPLPERRGFLGENRVKLIQFALDS